MHAIWLQPCAFLTQEIFAQQWGKVLAIVSTLGFWATFQLLCTQSQYSCKQPVPDPSMLWTEGLLRTSLPKRASLWADQSIALASKPGLVLPYPSTESNQSYEYKRHVQRRNPEVIQDQFLISFVWGLEEGNKALKLKVEEKIVTLPQAIPSILFSSSDYTAQTTAILIP